MDQLNQAGHYLGNFAPEGEPDVFQTSEDSPFTTGNVLLNDLDGDNDILSVTGIDQTETRGLVTANADGTFHYDPNGFFNFLAEGEVDTDTFAYFVSDGVEADRVEVIILINGQNDSPTARNDTAAVAEDGNITIDVLANDSDPDQNDILVLTEAVSALGATVEIHDNQLVYYADADVFDLLETGSELEDEITYTIKDDHGLLATATVKVTIKGRPDGEIIMGTRRPDELVGTDGEDKIYADRAADFVRAGDGADIVYGDRGDDRLFGEASIDTIYGEKGEDWLDGGFGDDFLDGGDGSDYLNGGNGNDELFGGKGWDTLEGGIGDDLLEGGEGSDDLFGGSGDDILCGGDGADNLIGGDGNDELFGGDIWDTLNGGAGDDLLDGGAWSDELFGGDGNDTIFGRDGWDKLDGGLGDDILDGGSSSDEIRGGDGDDELFGGEGWDDLDGGAGEDNLDGGGDRDTINGGTGDDILTGGDDRDTFIFAPGDGNDTITDFDIGSSQWFRQFFTGDRIDVRAYDFESDDDVLALATQDSNDTVIQLSESDSIRLVGVDVDDLDTFDFYT